MLGILGTTILETNAMYQCFIAAFSNNVNFMVLFLNPTMGTS